MTITNGPSRFPPPVLDNLGQLGARVASARKLRRLRQADLADMAGLSRSTLVEIEKGSPFVAAGHYLAVLWALGIMADILATDLEEDERRLVASGLPKRVRHG